MTLKFLPSLLFSFLFISSSYALDGDMYDFFLPNGLKVIMMEKHAAPKVAVMVGYNVGSHDEVEGQKGITNLIKEITNIANIEIVRSGPIAISSMNRDEEEKWESTMIGTQI